MNSLKNEIDSNLLYTHKVKGGKYRIVAHIEPAGDKARQLGTIVAYESAEDWSLPYFYRPISDFIENMEEYG